MPRNTKPILRVVEPQMSDFAHSPFNAAFVHTAYLAYPEAQVVFTAMASHLTIVREILTSHAPEVAERIEWETLAGPTQGGQMGWWKWSLRLLRKLLDAGDPIAFCSLSRMQLFQAKWLVRGRRTRSCVVLHGDLEELLNPRRDPFPLNLLSLPKVVRTKAPEGFRYLLLGESILENLPPEFGNLIENARVVEHPSHFSDLPPHRGSEVVFGIFGNTGDGQALETVAQAVKAVRPEVQFRLVGFLRDEETVSRLSPFIEGARATPLARAEFIEAAREVTHTLWLASPDAFRLRASGTFFDALQFAAPIVFTQNAYLTKYYREAPEIGWSCEDLDEIVETILTIIDGDDPVPYADRQAAILRFRHRFSPETQSALLRKATGWSFD